MSSMSLVEELQIEHQSLIKKVREAKGLVGSNDLAGALGIIKTVLLAHLKKEDNRLYPVLLEAAKTDMTVKEIVETFTKEMDGISKAALGFFEKYASNPNAHGDRFVKDFNGLVDVLTRRIVAEETVLYPQYTKIEIRMKVQEEFQRTEAATAAAQATGRRSPMQWFAGLALAGVAAAVIIKFF
jgi:hypothetical protein